MFKRQHLQFSRTVYYIGVLHINAKNILEIGTATGYSGLFLARIANKNGGELTTIEIDEKRYEIAKENFEKLGLLDKNKMILGE